MRVYLSPVRRSHDGMRHAPIGAELYHGERRANLRDRIAVVQLSGKSSAGVDS